MLGALNLYRTEPAALSPEDIATAQALADVATIAPLQNRTALDLQMVADQFQDALNSRVVIEQVKGIVAERLGVGVNEAFARMRRYARNSGRRLGEIAQEIIDGTLRPEEVLVPSSR